MNIKKTMPFLLEYLLAGCLGIAWLMIFFWGMFCAFGGPIFLIVDPSVSLLAKWAMGIGLALTLFVIMANFVRNA